jgi:hypothetical protein
VRAIRDDGLRATNNPNQVDTRAAYAISFEIGCLSLPDSSQGTGGLDPSGRQIRDFLHDMSGYASVSDAMSLNLRGDSDAG